MVHRETGFFLIPADARSQLRCAPFEELPRPQ
jgi:hypothetical protein